jgi:hypothetical protein
MTTWIGVEAVRIKLNLKNDKQLKPFWIYSNFFGYLHYYNY